MLGAMNISNYGVNEYLREDLFRFKVKVSEYIPYAGDQFYAEFEGPDGFALRSKGSTALHTGNEYLIDGPVDKESPFGFYAIKKLEIHHTLGGSKVIPLSIPSGSYGFQVVATKSSQALPPKVPKVVSLG